MFIYFLLQSFSLICHIMVKMKGGNRYIMKHKHSKIGEYGIKWEPVEGYKTKKGKRVPPHYKKVEFKWSEN